MTIIKTYAQLNIGRNVGNEPMPADEWARFIKGTQHVLASACNSHNLSATDTMVHHGTGQWEEDGQTITEDSAYISLYDPKGFRMDVLYRLSEMWADHWGQSLVAVVTN